MPVAVVALPCACLAKEAAFGQASSDVTDALTVIGGLRITNDVRNTRPFQNPSFTLLNVPATAPISSYSCGAAFD